MKKKITFWESEFEKCKKSIAYFYNNYLLINGTKPAPKKDEDFQFNKKRI